VVVRYNYSLGWSAAFRRQWGSVWVCAAL